DFSTGAYGEGAIDSLRVYDAFGTTAVSKLTAGDEKISTTKLKEDLASCRLEEVNDALGRPFEVQGGVVQGEKRGRTIGFPTANVEPEHRYHRPAKGV